jgi:hypothetical protein
MSVSLSSRTPSSPPSILLIEPKSWTERFAADEMFASFEDGVNCDEAETEGSILSQRVPSVESLTDSITAILAELDLLAQEFQRWAFARVKATSDQDRLQLKQESDSLSTAEQTQGAPAPSLTRNRSMAHLPSSQTSTGANS